MPRPKHKDRKIFVYELLITLREICWILQQRKIFVLSRSGLCCSCELFVELDYHRNVNEVFK